MQTTNHEMQNGKSATTNKNTEVRNLKHETGMLETGRLTWSYRIQSQPRQRKKP